MTMRYLDHAGPLAGADGFPPGLPRLTLPAAMEPLLPEVGPLETLAYTVVQEAAALGGQLPARTRKTVAGLLRVANAYYSNRIEGHVSRPVDIERALRALYLDDPRKRDLQREARAHVEVQQLMEARLAAEPALDVTSAAFLRWLHEEFYRRVPEAFRFVDDPETGRRESVVPGAFRTHDVRVGRHVAPEPDALPGLLDHFQSRYTLDALRPLPRVVALAASHHRLMWIHPFSDGNGRVTRLFSAAYAARIGLGGAGLWSVARGLARAHDRYKQRLAAADNERWNATDGRGLLSERDLRQFCHFFLETCLDQIRYMRQVLDLDGLGERLEQYAERRASGHVLAPGGGDRFRREAGPLLRAVMLRGELSRGEAYRAIGLQRTTAGAVIAAALADGTLVSPSPKGALRLGLPSHALPYLFPLLYPEGADAEVAG